MRARLDVISAQPQPLFDALVVDPAANHADRARDGVGRGNDAVGIHRYPVPARSSHLGLGDDHGFLGPAAAHGLGHDIGGQGVTPRRIDSQNHSADRPVVAGGGQFIGDTAGFHALFHVAHAQGVDDRHARCRAPGVGDRRPLFAGVDPLCVRPGQFAQEFVHLIPATEPVDQPGCHRVRRQQHRGVVGQGLELIGADGPGQADAVAHHGVLIVYQGLFLPPVGVRHGAARERFHGRLVVEQAPLVKPDADPVQQAPEVGAAADHARQVQCPERIKHHGAGRGSRVVGVQVDPVDIDHHLLARVTDLLQQGAHFPAHDRIQPGAGQVNYHAGQFGIANHHSDRGQETAQAVTAVEPPTRPVAQRSPQIDGQIAGRAGGPDRLELRSSRTPAGSPGAAGLAVAAGAVELRPHLGAPESAGQAHRNALVIRVAHRQVQAPRPVHAGAGAPGYVPIGPVSKDLTIPRTVGKERQPGGAQRPESDVAGQVPHPVQRVGQTRGGHGDAGGSDRVGAPQEAPQQMASRRGRDPGPAGPAVPQTEAEAPAPHAGRQARLVPAPGCVAGAHRA